MIDPTIQAPSTGSDGEAPARKSHLRLPLIALAACFVLLFLACGLIGGDGEEEGDGNNPLTPRPEILTKLAAVAAPNAASVQATAEAQDQPEGEAEEKPEAEADPEPEPTPAPALLVDNEDVARNLVWVHLRQCITLAATDLVATQITGDWYVNDSTESKTKIGLWKVTADSGAVEPNDVLSREWEKIISSECSPESLKALTTPTPEPTVAPAIADGPAAIAVVWAYLARCLPKISIENFETKFIASQDWWVITTKSDSATDFGAWTVNNATGNLSPYAGFSREWDSVIKLECNPEALASLSTPTPVPTVTPAVIDATQAVTTLWSYLVKCAPTMTTEELAATLNPAKGEWIVITKPGLPTDYGVWTVTSGGVVAPDNREAARRDSQVRAGTC